MRRAVPLLIMGIAALVVALAIVMQFIGGEEIGADERESPGSIANEAPEGTSGWAQVLRDLDYEVRDRRHAFDDADVPLPEMGTVIVVASPGISADEIDAVEAWIDSGSGDRRLVIVDATVDGVQGLVTATLPDVRLDSQFEPARPEPATPAPENVGLDPLAAESNIYFEPGSTAPVFALGGDEGRAYALRFQRANGNLTLAVADAQAVENFGIIEGDNAAFAVALAGADTALPVYFDQFHHRPQDRPGVLGFLPREVQLFLIQVVFAGVVLAFAVGVHFGEPLPEPETPPRRRIEFVNAIGRAYAETDAEILAADVIRHDLRELLLRRLRLGADAEDAAIIDAALRIGVPAEDLGRVLLGPVDGGLSFTEFARTAAQIRQIVDQGVPADGAS